MPLKPGRLEQPGQPVRLRYVADSPTGEIDALGFSDYLRETIHALQLTTETVADETGHVIEHIRYVVAELRMASPAEVVLIPQTSFADRKVVRAAQDRYVHWVSKLNEGTVPAEMDFATLRVYHKLGDIANRHRFTAETKANGSEASVGPRLKDKLDLELQKDQYSKGTVRGYIRSYHSAGRRFIRIYPRVGPSLPCRFLEGKHGKTVRNLIDRYVQVEGTLRFRPSAYHPYHMDMQQIEWIDVDSAPTFREMIGAFAGAFPSLPSEDVVRTDRDGW
jgi:hypothetical protein